MRLNVAAALVAVHAAVLSTPDAVARAAQVAARPTLTGTWTLNPSLGTPAGAVALGGDDEEPPLREDDAGRRRRPVGPGNIPDSPFATAGGASRGDPPPRRAGDRPISRALMEELLHSPVRLTIRQDGDRVVLVEPDGVAREYLANDKVERHQLVNATIETKARWDEDALVLELRASKRTTVVRRFEVRGGQLEVTTRIDGGPKHAKRVAIYESLEGAPPADR
jgi:hypothetical protein